MSVLDLIKSITSNRESGRLEINASPSQSVSSGTRGTLLFHEGKLVDARLGSLSGFQAVNAAVALRDAELSFDHVVPASHFSTITASERVVLSRFFGIEAADMEEPKEVREPEIDWNPAPAPVVPLAEAGTNTFFSRPRIAALFVAVLLGLVVGAVAMRSKVKTLRQQAAVASAVESQPNPISEPEPSAVSESQDLTGEWRIINTVDRTAYRSFANMQVGFHLTINQNGKEFTAKGEKFYENGQTLPIARRTPIQLKGSINGDKVVATFIEDGRMRRTNGRFTWKLHHNGDGLAGTFVSNAANSSGRSAVTKEQ